MSGRCVLTALNEPIEASTQGDRVGLSVELKTREDFILK